MFEEYKNCNLCPHSCNVDRAEGQLGRCKCDATPSVALKTLHFWEEPPISGNKGSGTIFFSGCSLSCVYCQNSKISRNQLGLKYTLEDIVSACLEMQNIGALNVNFVTPSHFGPHLRAASLLAKEKGLTIPIVWNTSGYELSSQIVKNAKAIDVYLSDFKYFDDGLARRFSKAPNYCEIAIEALDKMVKTAGPPKFSTVADEEFMLSGVVVRHMMLPGHLDDSKRIVELLLKKYGSDIKLSLMSQYTPVNREAVLLDPELNRTVKRKEFEELLDYADSLGAGDYFWQEGKACTESFIPNF